MFFENKKRYGSPRIYRQLQNEGISCGRHKVARIMKQEGLISRKKRTYRKPVSEQRIKPVAENILDRKFHVKKPDSIWAGDVTYVWTHSGWIHLAVMMDLFSRRIIGWSMGDKIDRSLTKNALEMALVNRNPKMQLLHHSDQGAEYTNKDYQTFLRDQNIVVSMSRRAECYDNAVVESFFKTIKAELMKETRFKSKEEARSAIFEYIEVYYNRKRMHSTLGYKSPVEFEKSTVN